jgi:hypothetical protein
VPHENYAALDNFYAVKIDLFTGQKICEHLLKVNNADQGLSDRYVSF